MSSPIHWRKSSFSGGGATDDCVELAASPDSPHLHLRESEDPGAVLITRPAALHGLLDAVKRGRL